MILVSLYIIVGSLLTVSNGLRVARDVPDPSSIASTLETALKYIVTWPWWAFKK